MQHHKFPQVFTQKAVIPVRFSRQIPKKIFRYQILQKSFQWGPSCCVRTDRRTGMTTPIDIFRSLTNCPEKKSVDCRILMCNVVRFPQRLCWDVAPCFCVRGTGRAEVSRCLHLLYEGWIFNSGNYLFTTDTKYIHVSKFYCPSMQSPALGTTRCQRCGSRRIPLAAPVVLIVRMERSTA